MKLLETSVIITSLMSSNESVLCEKAANIGKRLQMLSDVTSKTYEDLKRKAVQRRDCHKSDIR